MQIVQTKNKEYIIRLDRGDKWPADFITACTNAGVRGAFFYGIGGVEDPEVGYYDLVMQKYMTKKFEGLFEIVNITGNLSELNGVPVVHAHGVFAGPDYSVFGGHFVSGAIGGTLELCASDAGGALKRKSDPATGLSILTKE
jgi:predicted DNA-binding protein with PD1-like motif